MTELRSNFARRASRLTAGEAARRREHLRALTAGAEGSSAEVAAEPIVVRLLGDPDGEALRRLAGLDSAPVPFGEVLGAEVGGRLVAGLSLRDGALIADPFRPTLAAVELLLLRARQLGARPPRRRLRLRRRSPRGSALAPSPPGAGGRLLQL